MINLENGIQPSELREIRTRLQIEAALERIKLLIINPDSADSTLRNDAVTYLNGALETLEK